MQDKLFKVLLILSAIVIPVIGGGIIYSLTVDAFGAFEEFGFWHFIFSDDWVTTAGKESYGALPFITGTLLTTALALLMCIPFSLPVALFTGEYFRGKKIAAVLGTVIDLLAGIPSIIYGLFGMLFFNIALHWRYSMLSGAATLAIMVLPTIMRTTEEALLCVPDSYREGSFGLGAGKLRTIFKIVLPAAIPGILSGIILSIGRIVGETAALIYTAGTVTGVAGLMDSGRTLAIHMYVLSNEGLHKNEANATAVVLLVIVLLINGVSSLIAKRFEAVKE